MCYCCSKTAVVGTVLISVQVLTDSGRKLSFGDEVIQLGYTTKPVSILLTFLSVWIVYITFCVMA